MTLGEHSVSISNLDQRYMIGKLRKIRPSVV